jgi:putative endonuclease
MYFLYILECADCSLYTGITTDVSRRFEEHKAGTGARYTKSHVPVRIVYVEGCGDRSAAQIREAEIKKWSREKKRLFLKQQKKKTVRCVDDNAR